MTDQQMERIEQAVGTLHDIAWELRVDADRNDPETAKRMNARADAFERLGEEIAVALMR